MTIVPIFQISAAPDPATGRLSLDLAGLGHVMSLRLALAARPLAFGVSVASVAGQESDETDGDPAS